MALYKPTKQELDDILAKHKLWLETSGGDGARADLAGANLAGADLARADLARADLAWANLAWANLARAKNNDLALAITEIVPREGSFIGWKKCYEGSIVKLRITEDSKRSNASGRKCRASKVEVLEITDCNGNAADEAISCYDSEFAYHVGDVLEVADFDENRLNECAPGIHFYLTPEEAKAYIG